MILNSLEEHKMEKVTNITKDHPKEWKAFQKWHVQACASDNLSAEERFIKEGGIMPDVSKSNTRTKKKK